MLKAHFSFSWTAAHLHQAAITSRLTSGHNGLWGWGWGPGGVGGGLTERKWRVPCAADRSHCSAMKLTVTLARVTPS